MRMRESYIMSRSYCTKWQQKILTSKYLATNIFKKKGLTSWDIYFLDFPPPPSHLILHIQQNLFSVSSIGFPLSSAYHNPSLNTTEKTDQCFNLPTKIGQWTNWFFKLWHGADMEACQSLTTMLKWCKAYGIVLFTHLIIQRGTLKGSVDIHKFDYLINLGWLKLLFCVLNLSILFC